VEEKVQYQNSKVFEEYAGMVVQIKQLKDNNRKLAQLCDKMDKCLEEHGINYDEWDRERNYAGVQGE